MSRIQLTIIIVNLLITTLHAQVVQTVRGTVIDHINLHPVPNATVAIKDQDTLFWATTGETGNFQFNYIPVGRYSLQVRHISYKPYYQSEMLVKAGKELVINIKLEPAITQLEEIQITGDQPINPDILLKRTISVEQTRRYPASFYDPSRLSVSFPGVQQSNDQGNNIIIRGNTPNAMGWRLEGLEIVNPNHLTNTGTISDRPTKNGGGVNILSAQMLDDSEFINGNLPVEYGNALSGIYDMKFRRGNDRNREYFLQAGLLGIDLATEGPLKKGQSSYLANYRYSTVGLLTNLGIDFGDEEIIFQDLSFNINLYYGNKGYLDIFGMGGVSSNDFKAKEDSSEWAYAKDRFNINYRSKMGALGVKFGSSLAQNSSIHLAAVVSGSEDKREASIPDLNSGFIEYDHNDQTIISGKTHIVTELSSHVLLDAGINLSIRKYGLTTIGSEDTLGDNRTFIQGSGTGNLVRPFLQLKVSINESIVITPGLRYLYFSLTGDGSIEPSMRVNFTFPPSALSLSYGISGMTQLPGIYFYSEEQPDGSFLNPNLDLDFTRAHQGEISYAYKFPGSTLLRSSIYYQKLFNVPIEIDPSSSFSTLNILEDYPENQLVNKGKGENAGLEVSLEKPFIMNYYLLAGIALYNSKYRGADGIKRDTRYNGNYSLNITLGKEITVKKRQKLSLNSAFHLYGGLRQTPLDITESRSSNLTITDDENAFSRQLNDYIRWDLRIEWSKEKPGYTRSLSLDIQNVLNRENEAHYYYDFHRRTREVLKQLGIIPVLNYRIEF